ncbi:MAG: hypothetical protein L6Q71_07955, partial [Planctomycetes bacterium]|nr:hypothetical protein [Planctomycetota bacterium]
AAPTTVRQWERQPVPKMNERHAQLFNALKGAVKPSEIAQAHTLGDVFIERGRIAFWKEVARLYAVRLERRVLAAAGQPIAASLEECEVRSAESGVQEKAGAA